MSAPKSLSQLAGRLLAAPAASPACVVPARSMGAAVPAHVDPRYKIGAREVVGFGYNGGWNYMDRPDFPMPAVRFKEPDNVYNALHAKEKGDWKSLTLEEKKTLYRYSYCRTYSEMLAPTGVWKMGLAGMMATLSIAIWMYMGMKKFVLGPTPRTLSPEAIEMQVKTLIAVQANPIDGIASKWDYEKGEWKN